MNPAAASIRQMSLTDPKRCLHECATACQYRQSAVEQCSDTAHDQDTLPSLSVPTNLSTTEMLGLRIPTDFRKSSYACESGQSWPQGLNEHSHRALWY